MLSHGALVSDKVDVRYRKSNDLPIYHELYEKVVRFLIYSILNKITIRKSSVALMIQRLLDSQFP